MKTYDYFRGTHNFPWSAQITLAFGNALGGERRRIAASGHFTFEFTDDQQDMTPLLVRGFEIRVPTLEVYPGRLPTRSRLDVPDFTLTRTEFTQRHGWLERSTGRFIMGLEFPLLTPDLPIVGVVQRLGLLQGHDCATLRAHLFEAGEIHGHTGAFQADGRLYVADKEWQGPGDSRYLFTALSDQCDLGGSLSASIDRETPHDIILQCPGESVHFLYETINATSAFLVGSNGDKIPLALPRGVKSITPRRTGSVTYHLHLASDKCERDFGNVAVTVVGKDTDHHLVAPGLDKEGRSKGNWSIRIPRNQVNPRIRVTRMQIDPTLKPPVKDTDGNEVTSWLCTHTEDGTGTMTSFAVSKMLAPAGVGELPLIGGWVFTPMMGSVDAAKYPLAAFLLKLRCE